jgi:hypothetical protein
MIKILTVLTLATISFTVSGQNIDSLGANKNNILNGDESTYLNDAFMKKRGDFNFKEKKVGFFIGSSNYRLWNKQNYFEDVKGRLRDKTTMQHQLLILNENERIKSGGYDALVIAWSKILVTDNQKDKLIKKINRAKSKYD